MAAKRKPMKDNNGSSVASEGEKIHRSVELLGRVYE